MSQIDQRAGQRFEGIMPLVDALEAQQQAVEFILACEPALDGAKAFFE